MPTPTRPTPRMARLTGSGTWDTDTAVSSVDAVVFDVEVLAKVIVTKLLAATKVSDWMGVNAVLKVLMGSTGLSVVGP